MKLLYCVALLVAGHAQAGELLPMSGMQSRHMQSALDETLPALVESIPGIRVHPVLEHIRIAGAGKRVFWGPLAGGGAVVLKLQIIGPDGSERTEVITEHSGAWKGTFQPRNDLAMLKRVAEKAAEIVGSYSGSRLTAK